MKMLSMEVRITSMEKKQGSSFVTELTRYLLILKYIVTRKEPNLQILFNLDDQTNDLDNMLIQLAKIPFIIIIYEVYKKLELTAVAVLLNNRTETIFTVLFQNKVVKFHIYHSFRSSIFIDESDNLFSSYNIVSSINDPEILVLYKDYTCFLEVQQFINFPIFPGVVLHTSNYAKVRLYSLITNKIDNIRMRIQSCHKPEIQGTSEMVVKQKLRSIESNYATISIVDDCSFYIENFMWGPGPYIKYMSHDLIESLVDNKNKRKCFYKRVIGVKTTTEKLFIKTISCNIVNRIDHHFDSMIEVNGKRISLMSDTELYNLWSMEDIESYILDCLRSPPFSNTELTFTNFCYKACFGECPQNTLSTNL